LAGITAVSHNGGMRGMQGNGAIQQALSRVTRSVIDRIMRWRGRPPEEAGVREPRRPRSPLPAAAVALDEPRTGLRRRRWIS
jgi:hypothetical protein